MTFFIPYVDNPFAGCPPPLNAVYPIKDTVRHIGYGGISTVCHCRRGGCFGRFGGDVRHGRGNRRGGGDTYVYGYTRTRHRRGCPSTHKGGAPEDALLYVPFPKERHISKYTHTAEYVNTEKSPYFIGFLRCSAAVVRRQHPSGRVNSAADTGGGTHRTEREPLPSRAIGAGRPHFPVSSGTVTPHGQSTTPTRAIGGGTTALPRQFRHRYPARAIGGDTPRECDGTTVPYTDPPAVGTARPSDRRSRPRGRCLSLNTPISTEYAAETANHYGRRCVRR